MNILGEGRTVGHRHPVRCKLFAIYLGPTQFKRIFLKFHCINFFRKNLAPSPPSSIPGSDFGMVHPQQVQKHDLRELHIVNVVIINSDIFHQNSITLEIIRKKVVSCFLGY